jgi:hypothetical protein
MKRSTEKEMLLAAASAIFYFGIYFLFVKPILEQFYLGYFHDLLFLAYFFVVVASLFPFRSARWVRVAIGTIAFSTVFLLSRLVYTVFVHGVLPWLKSPGVTDTELIYLGIRFAGWQMFILLAAFVFVAVAFIVFGLWILKKRV